MFNYETIGGSVGLKMPEPCKPDYLEMASKHKKQMDSFTEYFDSTKKFIRFNSLHIPPQDKEIFANLIGSLEVKLVEMEQAYDELLAMVEREKVEGSK